MTNVPGDGTRGPFPAIFAPPNIALSEREVGMLWESIQNELLVTLAHFYEQDPNHFLRLPKQTVDSSSARVALAELRNEGYVEEQIRGEVRLTPMGYKVYKSKPLHA